MTAHKLRNAYRQSNKIGSVSVGYRGTKKILLTCDTAAEFPHRVVWPFTLIDENLFGDLPSFRTQYMNSGGDLAELRERSVILLEDPLRSQVLEYVNSPSDDDNPPVHTK
jgi:hypothetical protein